MNEPKYPYSPQEIEAICQRLESLKESVPSSNNCWAKFDAECKAEAERERRPLTKWQFLLALPVAAVAFLWTWIQVSLVFGALALAVYILLDVVPSVLQNLLK